MIHPADGVQGDTARADRALAAYDEQRAGRGDSPLRTLLATLAGAPDQVWLECAQGLVLRNDAAATLHVLGAALDEHPASSGVRLALAGVLPQAGDSLRAEGILRDLLAEDPDDAAATMLLARLLRGQGRMQAVASAVRALFRHAQHDAELIIRAVELLDDCGCKRDAAALCEGEIAAGSMDPRLHAYAGMLLSQLGQFELARTRQEFVLEKTPQAFEWHVPLGLSGLQRYVNGKHPDFARFREYLHRTDLSEQARASLLFALGKGHDDVGDYAQAADYLRRANMIVHASVDWPRKQWRRTIEARLGRKLPAVQLTAPHDWTPLFIVGMPRSGTTVLAERLANHPQVRQRGELSWLPILAEQVAMGSGDYRIRLERAAKTYAAQLRQDDSGARWFIDKQPHNFMHVDLILTLFPNARIICCQRGSRDNALSLWMQSFQTGTQQYAYDFTDIGAAIHGARRLMKHWLKRYPEAIRVVDYEQLATDPASCLEALSAWLELPAHDLLGSAIDTNSVISTASLWQARQPIHSRSVRRWRHYAAHVPELLQLPEN
jgi:tetratricopeptide (TPR) repeat protein